MKPLKHLFLTAFASLGLAWGAMPASSQAQTFNYEGYDIPSDYTNANAGITNDVYSGFVWTGTSGTLSDPGNYDVYLSPSINWIDPGAGGFLSRDFGQSVADNWGLQSGGGDILFSNTSSSTYTVQLTENALATPAFGGSSLVVGSGFVFDLNGFGFFGTNGAQKAYYNLVLGDGSGPATTSFIDSTGNANTATFGDLVIGANGSSNNIWGGPNSTVSFGANVTPVITGGVTVGSANGNSTGNVFNSTPGQTYGSITVNPGAGNEAIINGSTISGQAINVNGGSPSNTAAVVVNGGTLLIENGSVVNTSVGLNLAGGSTTINGSTVNSTGNSAIILGTGASLNLAGSTVTDAVANNNGNELSTAAGSTLVVDSTTINIQSAVNLGGTTTLQNGGVIIASTTSLVSDGVIGGTLNIIGNGSSYSDTSTSSGHAVAMSLLEGGEISVTQGGSFTTQGGLHVAPGSSGAATINVDSASTFTVGGNFDNGAISAATPEGQAINFTGGGTITVAGTFSTGAVFDSASGGTMGAGINDVLYDTSHINLNVGTLAWDTGSTNGAVTYGYSGIKGTIGVTTAIALSGQADRGAAVGAGTNLQIDGTVQISATRDIQLFINTGGTISGVGTVNAAATNGSGIVLNGGILRSGIDGETTGQAFNFNGTLSVASGSTLQFSLFSDTSSDQLGLSNSFLLQGKDITLKLDLVGLLSDFKLNVGDTGETFQLLTDLTGNAQGQTGADFTLDAGTLNQLAQDGFSVDTSNLDTDGTITLNESAVIPEPSTWALLILGAAGLLFFKPRAVSPRVC